MIVVFGGAFNPPTLAHREIYYLVSQMVDLETFIFLPVSKKYSKASLIEDHHRVEMLKLMTKEFDNTIISRMETKDPEYLGTYESLLRIKKEYPGKDIAFVMGIDNLLHLKHWIKAELLLSEFKFIVVNRNNQNVNRIINENPILLKNRDNFIIINDFHSNISSSLFRETHDPNYIQEDVYHYIMKHDLYGGMTHE